MCSGNAVQFSMRVLQTPAAVLVRRIRGGAVPDHHGHSFWVNSGGAAHCVAGRID